MGKESITLSMELAKTQCYEFECFEDNYSLTISTQGHKLDLNLSKTKQSLPIITNSHLNFRYLTASANL